MLESLKGQQKKILVIVLWINLLMFVVEFSAGWMAHSSALLADSLDMLGDTLIYSFSLYILFKSVRWRASAVLMKGLIQAAFAVSVLVEIASKLANGAEPVSVVMAVVGTLALLANGVCLFLLNRHHSDDINMRSVWLCSRNDVICNLAVLVAAGLVVITDSHWPDIVIGALIAGLFAQTAWTIISAAVRELRSLSIP